LPITFLRQLIGFYDDSLHAFLPRYLEVSMENFTRHQAQIRSYVEETFGRFFPIQQFEDIARQNMALFQRATTSMLQPFGGTAPGAGPDEPRTEAQVDMRELKAKLDDLQRQLEELNRSTRRSTGG
jgi:polyhydroxyalkanoate synthesis regulator protein